MSQPFPLICAFIVSIWLESGSSHSFWPQYTSLAGRGPVGYLGTLSQWTHVFENVIYAQSIVGDSIAVYRCWVLWNRNFLIVCVPFLMVIGSTVSGSAKIQPGSTVFDTSLDAWVKMFYSLAVAQNIITTSQYTTLSTSRLLGLPTMHHRSFISRHIYFGSSPEILDRLV
ncbi:hypothetical protein DFH06DRAFT_1388664 [Mycena polygramma]|nr:hypothetical protein DFH06DRAFT_1388664 [Mycena polygramma]